MAKRFENPWGNGGDLYPYEVVFNNYVSSRKSDIIDSFYFTNNNLIDEYDPFDPAIHTWVNSKKNIVIIIDPGHGLGSENLGTALTIGFVHKIRGDDGKPKLKKDGSFEKQKSYFSFATETPKLPDYVINDLKTWKIERIASNTITEARLTFHASQKIVEKIKVLGFTVFNTRTTEDLGMKLIDRVKIVNQQNANYFISVHADGVEDYLVSGSHSIYREDTSSRIETKIQRSFASDILSDYSVVPFFGNSPKKDERPLLVLKPINKAKRKTLIELGFITNYQDYSNIKNNLDNVANQIVNGLLKNIKNNFFIKGRLLGYYDKIKKIGLLNRPADFDLPKNKNRYEIIYEKKAII